MLQKPEISAGRPDGPLGSYADFTFTITEAPLHYKQIFIYIVALLYERKKQLEDVLYKQHYVPIKLEFNRSGLA